MALTSREAVRGYLVSGGAGVFLALIGAFTAQLLLARWHDRELG